MLLASVWWNKEHHLRGRRLCSRRRWKGPPESPWRRLLGVEKDTEQRYVETGVGILKLQNKAGVIMLGNIMAAIGMVRLNVQ